MRELTLHERIRNADASQQVENVKAKHAYLHGRADATGEWSVIWSRSDDCSWAHAFGRMRGFDQVYHGSVGDYDKMCMENWLDLYEVYPEVTGKDPRPLMECSVHTLVTDVIEVAADGKTARGIWISPGTETAPSPGKESSTPGSPPTRARTARCTAPPSTAMCSGSATAPTSSVRTGNGSISTSTSARIWWATWTTPTGLPTSSSGLPIPAPAR